MADVFFEATFDENGNSVFKETLVSPTVNQLPIIDAIADITVDEAIETTITVTASDPDVGQTVTLSLENLHDGTGVTLTDNVISIIATGEDVVRSPFNVTVVATDTMQGQTRETFVVTVTPIPVVINEPPVITYPESGQQFTMYLDEVLTIEVVAYDPEGQELTYGAEVLEGESIANVTVNGNIVTFDPNVIGEALCSVSVSVTDGSTSLSISFSVLVQERPDEGGGEETPVEGDIMFRDLWVKIKLGIDGNVSDLWMKFFASKGITSANITDAEDQYLSSLGYTGSLADKRYQFEQAQGIGR